jgi:transcriptional regulator with XRE-family HTH domain
MFMDVVKRKVCFFLEKSTKHGLYSEVEGNSEECLDISTRFRVFREYFQLTQPELADALGISKQTVSAIESEGRGLTRERVQQIVDRFQVDARFFFGQLDTIEEADLAKRKEDPKKSRLELIDENVREIKRAMRPAENIDKVAERVMLNRELREFVEMIQFWDANKLRRFKDIAYGFISGESYSSEREESSKKANAS